MSEAPDDKVVRPPAWHDDTIPYDDILHGRPPLELHFYDDIQRQASVIDFVEDLLVERSASVIYGESNSGKTFFALDLALHIASGRNWRGKEVKQGGVVYVALEGSFGFDNRVTAWREEIGGLDTPATFAAIKAPIDLLRPDADVPRLIEAIRAASARFEMPVILVVIDTLSRAMAGGNENASEDMGALVLHQDEVRQATGAAFLWVHHSGKDSARGARGHSLLRAAVDTEIEVTSEEGRHLATVAKQRELENGSAFEFSLRRIVLGKNSRGKDVTSCVVEHATDATQGRPARQRLIGHNRKAYEILCELLAAQGQTGHRGTPAGAQSVPEEWWRDRFYEGAIPGGTQDTKKRAFRRAADFLIENRRAAMSAGRVWLPSFQATDTPLPPHD